MKISFRLTWAKAGNIPRSFKSPAAYTLASDYVARISKFTPCELAGPAPTVPDPRLKQRLWLCDRGPRAKTISSEELATRVQTLLNSSISQLQIVIGGPDGFSPTQVSDMKPDLLWSFGPMTLPHEIAALIACEQIYRVYTILHRFPYHTGH